jgi:exosortase/archaeosortase family protein
MFRRWIERHPAFRHAASLAVVSGILLTAVRLFPWADPGGWLCRFTAGICQPAIRLLEVSCRLDGSMLSTPSFSVQVIPECSGLSLIAVFVAAVLLMPLSIRGVALGSWFGFAWVTFLNCVRIMILFLVGSRRHELLSPLHEQILPTLLPLMVFLGFEGWLAWCRRGASPYGHRSILKFALTASVIYLALATPWPVLTPAYRSLAGTVGGMLFERKGADRSWEYRLSEDASTPFNCDITIVNPALLKEDGSGPVRVLGFETRAIFFNPAAALVALILASPGLWRRKIVALAATLPLQMIACYVLVRFLIWHESAEIGLTKIPKEWVAWVSCLRALMVMEVFYVMPLACWMTSMYARGRATFDFIRD